MKILFGLTLLLVSGFTYASNLEVKGSEFLRREVSEALSLLPSNYLDSVKSKISIAEVPLKSDQFIGADLCKMNEGAKFGLTQKNKVSISAKLVSLAQTNHTSFNCSHGSFKKFLQAVIIHEVTHLKDNTEKISINRDFQRIVGMKTIQRSSKKKLLNTNATSSPDAYEFTNLEEALAVNVEFLVLDPEFECRKPASAKFLSEALGIKLSGRCKKNSKVVIQSSYPEDNYLLAANIDPSRIYQIHYLFAGQGQALMSRFGHAMFRLVVCAPFRKKAGPECMKDVSHHLALTYRAYMDDINIDYAKGMFGKYPSQLFIMRFLEIQQEYTKFDLRDLYSVPLKMTAEQKADFINLTIERYWTYQGKYFFFSNNCGSESQKHLGMALTEEQAREIHSITPQKIYKDIIKAKNNLTEENLEKLSREEMIKRQFLIPSIFSELDEKYQFLRKYFKSFSKKNLREFLKKTNATDRLNDYRTFADDSKSLDGKLKKQIVMKLVYIERYLAGKFLKEIPSKAFKLMNKDPEIKNEVMKMGQSLKSMSIQPWEVVHSQYGNPIEEEFESLYSDFFEIRQAKVNKSLEDQMRDLQLLLNKEPFANELKEIETLKEIKKMTTEFVIETNNIF